MSRSISKGSPPISFYFADVTHFSPSGVLALCRPFIKNLYIHTECDNRGPYSGEEIVAHRERIAQWCRFREKSIVVHHPADLLEVARIIASQQEKGVVVVTGALEIESSNISDAMMNLGSSLIAVQLCTPGVYIVINGSVFPWFGCRRNPETGCFEAL